MKSHPTRPFGKMRFGPELFVSFLVMGAGVLAAPLLMLWYGLMGLAVGLVVSVVAGGLAFAFVLWMSHDANRALKAIQIEHRHTKPDPDGDMTAVAGAPELPPWMGVSK